ncbi:MAG: MqnA/MqnD/SBP family protein [Halarcobacter ebronensis]
MKFFAKIDFINLLPVTVYMKKNIKSNQLKAIIEYKKSYPSAINKKFKKRSVESAFISSIASRGEKSLDYGIIARNEVTSVLLVPGVYSKDFQSDTSNALAKVLNLNGQVIIGDKALKFFHENDIKSGFIDLAKAWQDKYNLPFVFARLSYNKNAKLLKKTMKNFNKRHTKFPQYILEKYEKRSGISKEEYLRIFNKNRL